VALILLLRRDIFTDRSVTGQLSAGGAFECYTLEDTDRRLEAGGAKIKDRTAIPRGTYPVVLDFSPRFQVVMPHVLDVPGFSGVRIHSGNRPEDTEGCILVGRTRAADLVGESRAAYNALYAKLLAAQGRQEAITLEVLQ